MTQSWRSPRHQEGSQTSGGGRSALATGLRLLGLRDHSRDELERKLRRRYGADEILAALNKLGQIGLIDDAKFAVSFARTKLQLHRWGRQKIYFELLKRGVSRELSGSTTANLPLADQQAAADSLVASRQKQWGDLLPLPDQERRLIGLLSRRGFSWPIIHQALHRIR